MLFLAHAAILHVSSNAGGDGGAGGAAVVGRWRHLRQGLADLHLAPRGAAVYQGQATSRSLLKHYDPKM